MRYQYLLVSLALAFQNVHAFVKPVYKSTISLGLAQQPSPSSSKTSNVLLAAHNIENDDISSASSSFDPLDLASSSSSPSSAENSSSSNLSALWVGSAILAVCTTPTVASAAAGDAIPSAFAAYVHYLSLLLITASVMTERLTVKPAMNIDEEKLLGYADIMTGVAGTALAASGYFRATAYGKGWDFYSHEPIFWLKMIFLGIFGGLSLFPTITIIQRTVKIQQEGTIEPMSEELANRRKKVMNAELTALATIPLTATLMARGVGSVNEFPTQIVGPVLFGVVTAGAVYKYVKDAISWKEDGLSAVGMEEE